MLGEVVRCDVKEDRNPGESSRLVRWSERKIAHSDQWGEGIICHVIKGNNSREKISFQNRKQATVHGFEMFRCDVMERQYFTVIVRQLGSGSQMSCKKINNRLS